jgi:hypothetical protein
MACLFERKNRKRKKDVLLEMNELSGLTSPGQRWNVRVIGAAYGPNILSSRKIGTNMVLFTRIMSRYGKKLLKTIGKPTEYCRYLGKELSDNVESAQRILRQRAGPHCQSSFECLLLK